MTKPLLAILLLTTTALSSPAIAATEEQESRTGFAEWIVPAASISEFSLYGLRLGYTEQILTAFNTRRLESTIHRAFGTASNRTIYTFASMLRGGMTFGSVMIIEWAI